MLECYIVIKCFILVKNSIKNKDLGYKDVSWFYLEMRFIGD